MNTNLPIPNRLIFIWYGTDLPWTCQLAIRSAHAHCSPKELLLYHQGLSPRLPFLKETMGESFPRCIEIDKNLFDGLPVDKGRIWSLYSSLGSPASKANLVRLAVLWKTGGVYLDGDTVTLKDLEPLRRYRGFCGVEPVALPSGLYNSANPLRWVKAGALLGLRELCARLPRGFRHFKRLEKYYSQSVNNAVLGAAPQNPAIGRAFHLIEAMAPEERLKRFRLGTHLLQRATGNVSSSEMEVLSSEHFYPLGPEVSAHWFRPLPPGAEREWIGENTYVAHWYQSVEGRFLKAKIDGDFVLQTPGTPFSRIASRYLE